MCMIHKLQMLDMHVCACFHFRQVRNKKKQRKAAPLSDTTTVTREEYSKDLLSLSLSLKKHRLTWWGETWRIKDGNGRRRSINPANGAHLDPRPHCCTPWPRSHDSWAVLEDEAEEIHVRRKRTEKEGKK